MKKILLPLILLCYLNNASAQKKARIAFNAGGNLSNMYFNGSDGNDNGENKVGYSVGLLINYPLNTSLSIQPGFNVIQKGMKSGKGEDKISLNINYAEIPLNVVYNFKSGIAGRFFIGAGPYIAAALYGNIKYKSDGDIKKDGIDFGKTEQHLFRAFDMGGNVIAGFTMKERFMVTAFYSRGFYDLNPLHGTEEHGYNQSFGLKLGWFCKPAN